MRNGRLVVASAVGLIAVATAACSSSGTASPNAGPDKSTGAAPSPSATVGPVTGLSTSGSAFPTGTGAPTSVPVVVPTGTDAPYPTPGHGDGAKRNQKSVLGTIPGSPSDSCQRVGDRRDVRAGSIAAGNFATARSQFSSEYGTTEVPSLDLYLIPQHAGHLTKAVAVLDPSGSGKHTRVTSTSVQPAESYRYFAIQLPVAKPGTYRLTLRSGRDEGCFVVSFDK